ncbi:MAG: hypothetical protein IPP79_19175 [Chitinophagaceae bacterium]|nr:hypothetical protein [Chitinophagaceae bacterium]
MNFILNTFLPCTIGGQEMLILFSILVPAVLIYVAIRAFAKGYRKNKQ